MAAGTVNTTSFVLYSCQGLPGRFLTSGARAFFLSLAHANSCDLQFGNGKRQTASWQTYLRTEHHANPVSRITCRSILRGALGQANKRTMDIDMGRISDIRSVSALCPAKGVGAHEDSEIGEGTRSAFVRHTCATWDARFRSLHRLMII